jgi:hypothetical protein
MERRTAIAMALLLGCGGTQGMEEEHTMERAELAQEQTEERNELSQDHAEDHAAIPAEAQGDLAGQTDEVRNDQAEAAAETQRLQALVVQACSGIAEPDQAACPLAAEHVESMRNVDDGISLGLKRDVGSVDQIETRLNCYRARATLRADQMNGQIAQNQAGQVPTAQDPATGEIACLVDYPDVEIDVNETRGRVFVELTATEDGEVTLLRSRARELTARQRR